MIRYVGGEQARIGDTVLIDNGERTGNVEEVIDTDLKVREWGVAEPGVMITSDYYGRLFLPVSCFDGDEIRLASRRAE